MRISGREERVSKMINSGMSVARIERAKKEKKRSTSNYIDIFLGKPFLVRSPLSFLSCRLCYSILGAFRILDWSTNFSTDSITLI